MGIRSAYIKYRFRRIIIAVVYVAALSITVFSGHGIYWWIQSLIPVPQFDLLALMETDRRSYVQDGIPLIIGTDTVHIEVVYPSEVSTALPQAITGKASRETIRTISEQVLAQSRYTANKRDNGLYVLMDAGVLVFHNTEFRFYRIRTE